VFSGLVFACDNTKRFAHGRKRETQSKPSTESVYCFTRSRSGGDGAYVVVHARVEGFQNFLFAKLRTISAVLLRSEDYSIQIAFILQMSSLGLRHQALEACNNSGDRNV
jgi:hypothetical protein